MAYAGSRAIKCNLVIVMKRGTTTVLQLLICTAILGTVLTAAILLFRHSAAQNAETVAAVEHGYVNKAVN